MVKYVSVFNFMLSNNFTLIKKLIIHLSYLYIIVVLIFPFFLSLFPFDEKVLFSQWFVGFSPPHPPVVRLLIFCMSSLIIDLFCPVQTHEDQALLLQDRRGQQHSVQQEGLRKRHHLPKRLLSRQSIFYKSIFSEIETI